MSRVAEEEDRLFEAWASRYESFVRDGIVDADEHARSPVKLLFVLKEVNVRAVAVGIYDSFCGTAAADRHGTR